MTPLVHDLGASTGLIPFKSDFFDCVQYIIPVCDFSKFYEVIGSELLSTSLFTWRDNISTYHKWLITYHHLRSAFSVLKFFIWIVEKSIIFEDQDEIHLTIQNHIDIPFDVFESNVPIVWNSICTEAEKKKYGFSMCGSNNFAGHHHFSDALFDGTTPTKETLDHEFSTYFKICCPCSMPIHLDLRKNFFCGTGTFGSACNVSKCSYKHMKLMNPLVYVMKYLLSSLLFSSLLQISIHLHFVNPVSWLALCVVCLKSTNQQWLNWIKRVPCLGMPPKLVIVSRLTNKLPTTQADCNWAMVKNSLTNQIHGDTILHDVATELI